MGRGHGPNQHELSGRTDGLGDAFLFGSRPVDACEVVSQFMSQAHRHLQPSRWPDTNLPRCRVIDSSSPCWEAFLGFMNDQALVDRQPTQALIEIASLLS